MIVIIFPIIFRYLYFNYFATSLTSSHITLLGFSLLYFARYLRFYLNFKNFFLHVTFCARIKYHWRNKLLKEIKVISRRPEIIFTNRLRIIFLTSTSIDKDKKINLRAIKEAIIFPSLSLISYFTVSYVSYLILRTEIRQKYIIHDSNILTNIIEFHLQCLLIPFCQANKKWKWICYDL